MCLYINSEVVLANLLVYQKEKSSVATRDVMKYCQSIKNELSKIKCDGTEYIYFNISQQSIDEAISRYNYEFRKFGDKIYKNNDINLVYFNARYSKEIVDLLKNTAESYN